MKLWGYAIQPSSYAGISVILNRVVPECLLGLLMFLGHKPIWTFRQEFCRKPQGMKIRAWVLFGLFFLIFFLDYIITI